MATTDFSEIFDTMKAGVVELAKGTIKDYVSQATEEGQNALTSMREDLKNWTNQVAKGDMNIDDLKFLIEGSKELTEMRALKQLGIAQIQLDQFKSGLMNLIVGSISKLI